MAAMVADRARPEGLPQAQMDSRAAQRLDQERAGVWQNSRFTPVQHVRLGEDKNRVQAGEHGAESAPDGRLTRSST